MQTKTNLLDASKTNTRDLVKAAKSVAPKAQVSLNKEGDVLVDGQEAESLERISGLISHVGGAYGEDLRTIALRHYIEQESDDAKEIVIIVENLQGRKKAYSQSQNRVIDGLSADLVEVGGVYMATINDAGFALIDPDDEYRLTKATDLAPHFGFVPPFVFEAVWSRIRGREAEELKESQEVEMEQQISSLHAGGSITLGGLAQAG